MALFRRVSVLHDSSNMRTGKTEQTEYFSATALTDPNVPVPIPGAIRWEISQYTPPTATQYDVARVVAGYNYSLVESAASLSGYKGTPITEAQLSAALGSRPGAQGSWAVVSTNPAIQYRPATTSAGSIVGLTQAGAQRESQLRSRVIHTIGGQVSDAPLSTHSLPSHMEPARVPQLAPLPSFSSGVISPTPKAVSAPWETKTSSVPKLSVPSGPYTSAHYTVTGSQVKTNTSYRQGFTPTSYAPQRYEAGRTYYQIGR